MNLVIVESPTKAKTISKFLNKDYVVKSSYGHLRDLPKSRLGVDVKHDFEPTYVVAAKNKKTVRDLKEAAEKSDLIYFATDEDREGEAIAWHLEQILKPAPKKSKRIAFHEITKEAILAALKNPRAINLHLVDAQQARRILDRLVGYCLSPFLWRKIAKGLSAGRVQSTALRLIVEREREILEFKSREYWTIEARFQAAPSHHPDSPMVIGGEGSEFAAKLIKFDGQELDKFDIASEARAKDAVGRLEKLEYKIGKVTRKETRRFPQPPFTTSSLQQEANHLLGFTAKQTMKIAQELYEGVELGDEGQAGLITYMRTDSVNLSEKFKGEARQAILEMFGKEFLPAAPRAYKTKSKLAQEAHEAIRPSSTWRAPEKIKQYLSPQQLKLYALIWRRAMASQMANALLDTASVDATDSALRHIFRASGSVIKFQGFLRLYETPTKEILLPELSAGQKLETKEIVPKQHFTEPAARYNDATLVKTLEQYGIGRPSTYAPTISTLLERNYVLRDSRQLMPTDLGMSVNDLLVEHFGGVVDYQFTAKMENQLDEIAQGAKKWVPVIREFYNPFSEHLAQKEKEVAPEKINEPTEEICKNCGKKMVVKMSRYGKFLACSGFPACRYTAQIKKGGTGGETQKEATETKVCPKCGGIMDEKNGRFGAYFKCAKCGATLTKQVSLGVACPACGQVKPHSDTAKAGSAAGGEILERKTGRGRVFYSCSRYPDCKFALWNKPTGEKCPPCGSLLVFAANGKVKCSSKECDYKS